MNQPTCLPIWQHQPVCLRQACLLPTAVYVRVPEHNGCLPAGSPHLAHLDKWHQLFCEALHVGSQPAPWPALSITPARTWQYVHTCQLFVVHTALPLTVQH